MANMIKYKQVETQISSGGDHLEVEPPEHLEKPVEPDHPYEPDNEPEEEEIQPKNANKKEKEDLSNYQLTKDRCNRQSRALIMYGIADLISFAFNVAECIHDEPKSFKDVCAIKYSKNWLTARNKELDSLDKNKTWILVNGPKRHKIVGCKWI